MWHKVSPQIFRIPYIKNWTTTWFAWKKDYVLKIKQDNIIRQIIKKDLSWVPVWDVIISRDQDDILVTIYTSKSAFVLGKEGENLYLLEQKLNKKTKSKIKITVKEIKKPEIDAKIVAFMISNQIEKRMPYKRAIKQAISKAMEKWAKWIKIKVWWRLNWAEIARKELFKDWNIPSQTIRSNIDYCSNRAETVYWTIWLKVWIYKWDIFKK